MNRIKRLALTLFLISILFPIVGNVFLQAEEDELDIMNLSLEELLNTEVVLPAKFSQKMSEAPSVISIITKDHIRQYGWLSMNNILSMQPGFFSSQDYDRRTVGSRGLFEGWNNNHLLLLIDGIPHNDNLYGTAYTWEITPLFFVKSLEIIRGPGSALYGSNATNGVLNINTLSASDLKNGAILQLRLGNYNSQVFDLVAGGENKVLSYTLGFNTFRTTGNEYLSYDGSYRSDNNNQFSRFNTGDSRSSNYFFGKLSGKNHLDGLEFQIHYQSWNFETGHGWLWMIPDFDEAMKESRIILSMSYKPESNKKLMQEYVIKYQRHNIDWNMRLYPDGAFGDYYPTGTWEYLRTDAEDIFARAQLAAKLKKDIIILGGVEGTLFTYNGDEEHFSNTDLNDEGGFLLSDGSVVPSYEGYFAPFPQNEMRSMGPWFEWVNDHPVKNIGIYGQFFSGNLLGKKTKATLGIRYDFQSFTYNAIDKPDKPEESKTFSQLSPRLGLVYLLSPKVSIKVLAGKAFRAPSPTEMFGANTWTLGSNLKELKPEIITTFELAFDWKISKNLNLRINGFHTNSENQIAYSVENNNLSTNIYTLTNAGLESELLFSAGYFNGFINYSFTKRLSEEIFDQYIEVNDKTLTWAPAHTLKFAANYKQNKWSLSIQGYYQGKVKRRQSDFAEPLFVPLRPEEISAWFSMNSRISYALSKLIEIGVTATNLFDSDLFLVKNFSYPFDYRMMGRRIFAELRITLN
jgi:outer membrane receptor protein involved in Fe transport